MADLVFILANGALVLVMLVVSCFAPSDQRSRVIAAALVIGLNWLLYVLAWSPVPPASALWAIGIKLPSEDLWALTDAVSAVAMIGLGHRYWWGWTIWGAYTVQVLLHIANAGGLTFDTYATALDKLFLVQVACLLFVGGRGAKDHLLASRVVYWLGLSARKCAQARP